LTPPRRRIVGCLAALAALLLAGGVPAARGDGDPASDVLLEQNVFYPYAPPTSPSLGRELDGAAAAAARAGVPVKVALIASPLDLGAVTQLWDRPQPYADYLDQEISYATRQPLIVVMADGYGTRSLTAPEAAAVASLPLPRGHSSDDLARAAVTAVRRIAAAAGHPIAAGATAAPGGSDATVILVVALSLGAVGIAGGIAAATLRRAPAAAKRTRRARR
jgi:hypothetical protein